MIGIQTEIMKRIGVVPVNRGVKKSKIELFKENKRLKSQVYALTSIKNNILPQPKMIDAIFNAVYLELGITPFDIKSKKRKKEIVRARWIVTYLLRNRTNLTLTGIGKLVGRDHSTVLNAIAGVEEWIEDKFSQWKNERQHLENVISGINEVELAEY